MKILIVTKNWLGDLLFQFPALEMIKVRYPDSEIVCMAPARCREILAAHPAVSRVLIFDEKREHRSILSRLRFALDLRAEKWDQAYFFHRSRTRAFLLWLGGVKERIGYGAKRRWFLTRPVPEPDNPMHQVDYFVELLARAGFPRPAAPAAYRFYFSDKDRKSAADLLEREGLKDFVCFHLGANWEPKRWPPAHFAELADLIFEKWGFPVIVTGASRDRTLADAMVRETRKARVISLTGKTGLGELGALYGRSQLVVSGDSGPMHIASGAGARVAALFGPTDPDLTGPRGVGEKIVLRYVPPGFKTPWYGEKLPPEGWLSHIQPEEVMRAIEDYWGEHGVFGGTGGSSAPAADDRLRSRRSTRLRRDQARTAPRAASEHPMLAPPNILIVTLSNIGDAVLNTPVIMALASEFPGAEMTVVASPRTKDIFSGSRFIRRLVLYDKHASLLEKLEFLKELRRRGPYDWVVDLKNTAIPYLVKTRNRSPLFRRFNHRCMRERHLDILRKMGLVPQAIPLFDFFDLNDERGMLAKLGQKGIQAQEDWILAAPVAASGLKTWRFAGFQEVIERLLAGSAENILLVGGERERPMLEPLVKINPLRVHNLAGQTTLRELAVLVSRCSLLLANDSSVMHLGLELRRPVVGVFGPTPPERADLKNPLLRVVREPVFCSPCDRPRCRFERQACFEDLSAQKVFQACQELLHVPSV